MSMSPQFRKVRCVVCNYSRRQSDCERVPVNRLPMWICKWCGGAINAGETTAAGVRAVSE
jgi:hypothetical protein